jgi:hypothetical protein
MNRVRERVFALECIITPGTADAQYQKREVLAERMKGLKCK